MRSAAPKLDAEIEILDAKSRERLTWRFETSAEQFKHDTTAKLVADLTAFLNPNPTKGLVAHVLTRRAFAESVQQETIGKYETKWADAIKSIADKEDSPKYGGLEIKPQLGLIPIGKDPASGLWEFAHLATGDPAERDADGKLLLKEETGLVFVLLPGGTFAMGAQSTHASGPNYDPQALSNEGPVHEVTLSPFFLSKYEMTQGQWLRLVGSNPSRHLPGTKNQGKVIVDFSNPVEQVSWEDCDLWLGRLGLMLPTEAQWEYAARGGTTTPWWTGLEPSALSKAASISFCMSAARRKDGSPLTPDASASMKRAALRFTSGSGSFFHLWRSMFLPKLPFSRDSRPSVSTFSAPFVPCSVSVRSLAWPTA